MMSTSPTPSQSIGDSWNERMRMIRLRRKKEAFRFREEFRIVPRWLKVLCVLLYIVAIAIGVLVVHYSPDARPSDLRDDVLTATIAVIGIITAVGFLFACFLLMLGYVNRDARRRGMNSTLWTLLVLVLSPGYVGIGFIIYFLIREPLPYPCPRCSQLVGPRFNFCPNCKCDLHPSCPNCKHEIAETDKFCPYCAYELGARTSPPSLPGAPIESPQ
jgi:Double zinc ribbon